MAFKGTTDHRAAIKELQRDLVQKLRPGLFKYFTDLYEFCKSEVVADRAPWVGPYADLKFFQDKLKEIPQWNNEVIRIETAKVLEPLPKKWPADDIIWTILYLKSMVISSLRPADVKEDVYIPLASVETFLHTAMRTIARSLFSYPSLVRRYSDDDEHTYNESLIRLQKIVQSAIMDAITDLTPTAEIVSKYAKQCLQSAQRETEPRPVDDSEKYGFDKQSEIGVHDDDDDDETEELDDLEEEEFEDDDISDLDNDHDHDYVEHKSPIKDKEHKREFKSESKTVKKQEVEVDIPVTNTPDSEKTTPPPPQNKPKRPVAPPSPPRKPHHPAHQDISRKK